MSATAKDVYTVKVRCGNCGYTDGGVFKKGQTVRESKCPECGCREVLYPEPERSAGSMG